MLIIMLLFAALAGILFLIDAFRSNWQSFTAIGLAALSTSVVVYALYLLEAEGKL